MSSWSKPWSDCPPCPALVQLPQLLQTQMSTSSSMSCREDFCPNSRCFCFSDRALPTGWGGSEVLRALVFSLCPGHCSFLHKLSSRSIFWKHFLEVPRRTPEPEPCQGEVDQSKGLWYSRHLCRRKQRACKTLLPLFSSASSAVSWSFPALAVFPSASGIFSICLSHPPTVSGRWNRAGAITGLCCSTPTCYVGCSLCFLEHCFSLFLRAQKSSFTQEAFVWVIFPLFHVVCDILALLQSSVFLR